VIRNLILTSLILVSCQNFKDFERIDSYETLVKSFRDSNEYIVYKESSDYYLTVLTTYKIKEFNKNYICTNSGEALAFEEFIKNNTQLTLEVVSHNLEI
tara:strand:- start:143 stop:439 length:297 start_codon:yes stop_codon:yes gene_type:complete